MQCIIRAPVDGGSLSQWLVINKIIGERWQRFLEFFLICTSSRAEFFATPFSICEGWLSDDPLSDPRIRRGDVHLHRPDIWDPRERGLPRRICMSECPARLFFFELYFIPQEALQGFFRAPQNVSRRGFITGVSTVMSAQATSL